MPTLDFGDGDCKNYASRTWPCGCEIVYYRPNVSADFNPKFSESHRHHCGDEDCTAIEDSAAIEARRY